MQLTRYTDFGVRTLMYLAMQPNRESLFRIAEITDVFDLSSNHVSKIVHHLGKLGYLQTVRGKCGGFRLGMAPEAINIGQLVRSLEHSLAPIDCGKPYCRFAPACKLQGILGRAVKAYLAVLDQYTLADIVTNRDELAALLPEFTLLELED
ncbi:MULTISPECIES: Rrf2 family transcriptional regulator [Shewanella]|jgi:Rrf2 family nitric oxide-sensitive transcriptional repressor|uniref:BadM/Rrf2 family transcriptional regulator n=1 Tax=Shewanella fodinae TaxID=552357 RepID=A0A4R2FC37_9GAMM|nr:MULTISPECIES: Rrf2 family transcriptional regulator [Shewanella]MBO1272348.1 Rrf2 family transcriptional regulator [Shewanella sp. 4t3-1-2LB]MCL2908289.1 Rrf2 family transcriptional regulator [Shewanella fodinae]TCN84324.1 BadM/Rrf2 family transcriptional regulator [Shewanella fodinae]GGZ15073.1 transcriptional regulator [Shewanella fodinae]